MAEHRVLIGDALARLREVEGGSVHLACTSPPYFNLRRYMDAADPAAAHELGNEETVEEYVAHLVAVFAEVKRVLRDDGVCFIVIGDSYNAGRDGGHPGGKAQWRDDRYPNRSGANEPGLKPKDLLLVPFALAFALRADGWYVRSVLPWVKWQSCMPESTKDRPVSAVEYVLLCSKQARYFWDAESIKRALSPSASYGGVYAEDGKYSAIGGSHSGLNRKGRVVTPDPSGRSYRNADAFLDSLDAAIDTLRADLARLEAARANGGLLTDEDGEALALLVNPQPFTARKLGIKDGTDHYAAFPPKLVEPLVKAACPERCCAECGAGWERVIRKGPPAPEPAHRNPVKRLAPHQAGNADAGNMGFRASRLSGQEMAEWRAANPDITLGWQPSCSCFGHFITESVPTDGAAEWGDVEALLAEMAQSARPQVRRAAEIFAASDLNEDHVYAIVSAGITDVGKATVTQTGTGKNTAEVNRLAAEAKAALGGYYREFVAAAKVPKKTIQVYVPHIPLAEHPTRPGVVLDPFSGTGTTAVVASRLGRNSISVELNPQYGTIIEARVRQEGSPLFSTLSVEAPAPNGHRQAALMEGMGW